LGFSAGVVFDETPPGSVRDCIQTLSFLPGLRRGARESIDPRNPASASGEARFHAQAGATGEPEISVLSMESATSARSWAATM
jgi:hypothetical protein